MDFSVHDALLTPKVLHGVLEDLSEGTHSANLFRNSKTLTLYFCTFWSFIMLS